MTTTKIQISQSKNERGNRKPNSQRSVLFLLLRKKASLLGLILCVLVVFAAVFAPVITVYDPLKIDVPQRLQTPSSDHWLGTDELGRDILTRLIYGARISIAVGFISVFIAILLGVPLGMISAFYGKTLDSLIMRVMDALAAFPAILLALAILSALGPNLRNAMIAIGIVYLPAFSRLARGTILSVKENDYVEATRACGATNFHIMTKTILPNSIAPIIVHSSIAFASAIIVEAALSFLGLGVQPPTPSWGAMLNQGRQFMSQTVWYSASAGLAIFLTVLGVNLLGDGLRDVLDPHLRGR